MNTHTRIENSAFFAAAKALVKFNTNNSLTAERMQQLFANRRPKVGIMLVNAQRHDYETFQRQQKKAK